MLTIIETPIFQRMVEGIWSEPEREAFIVFISDNPLAGRSEERRVGKECA